MIKQFSHSSLKTYSECPRKFKFQKIERKKVPHKFTADTFLGSSIHRTLRKLYTLGADGILWPIAEAIAYYENEWEAVPKGRLSVTNDFYTIDDYIRVGREMLVRHYEKYQPFSDGRLLGTEMRLSFALPGTGAKIVAIIDRLWKRDDGVVEICDYKTGQRLPQPTSQLFRHQMGLYQLAVAASFPQFEKIELAQYFLRPNEVVSYRMSVDELDELAAEVDLAIGEIGRATRVDDFPAKEGNHCRYCDYQAFCPAKRHQRWLDRTEEENSTEEEKKEELTTVQLGVKLAERFIELYIQQKDTKAAFESAKEDIVEFARENDLSVVQGKSGSVKVRIEDKEKFVTLTDDRKAFADLSALARSIDLDEYFKLDGLALMKELYGPSRLPKEQLEKLKQFVVTKESKRVTPSLHESSEDESTE